MDDSHNIREITDQELEVLLRTVMPDRDLAWQAGFLASKANIDLDANPYHIKEAEYDAWLDGWWTQFYNGQDIIAEVATEAQAEYIISQLYKNKYIPPKNKPKEKPSFFEKLHNFYQDHYVIVYELLIASVVLFTSVLVYSYFFMEVVEVLE